jgi:hypothetical protein
MGDLKDKHGINLLKIFVSNDEASQVMQNLVLDDEATIKLAWYYVEPTASFQFDEFIEHLTPKTLDQFREAFWDAVVGFSSPLKQNLLRDLWGQMKRDLKKASLSQMSNDAVSDLPQEETF